MTDLMPLVWEVVAADVNKNLPLGVGHVVVQRRDKVSKVGDKVPKVGDKVPKVGDKVPKVGQQVLW